MRFLPGSKDALSRLSVGVLLGFAVFVGCGDGVEVVNVSVKTVNADETPHRYLEFTLNGQGMITNKDGVKNTPLKLKKGATINFDIAPLTGGLVLANPQERSQWTKTFNGEAGQTIEYLVVLKKEDSVAADAAVDDTAADGGVAPSEVAEPPKKSEPARRLAGLPKKSIQRKRQPVFNDEPSVGFSKRRTAQPKRPSRPEPPADDLLGEDGVLDLPSDPPPRRDPVERVEEPVRMAPKTVTEVDDDPLLGLTEEVEPPAPRKDDSPIDDLPELAPTKTNKKNDQPSDDLLGDDGLLMGDAVESGGPADLDSIKRALKSGRALSAADIGTLESVPKKPRRQYVEAKRLLADWYYQNKQWRKQANALKIATESRGPYRKDPTVLLSLAKAYGHLRNYRQASRVMKKVERHGNRLSKERRADAYRFFAEMLEFQYLQQKKDDPEKANLELLDQAIDKLRKLRTYAGNAPKILGYANDRIGKLQELKRSDAE